MRKNRKLAAVTAAVLTAAMAFSAVMALAGSAASAAEEETEEESESYSEEELGTQLDDILKKGVITIFFTLSRSKSSISHITLLSVFA